jgi:hypothetical protein
MTGCAILFRQNCAPRELYATELPWQFRGLVIRKLPLAGRAQGIAAEILFCRLRQKRLERKARFFCPRMRAKKCAKIPNYKGFLNRLLYFFLLFRLSGKFFFAEPVDFPGDPAQ